MDSSVHQAVTGSNLTAIDKLAVKTALSSLEMLKQASSDLGRAIELLTHDDLIGWIRSK